MYVPLISPRYASGDFLPRVLAYMDKFNPVPQSYFGDWNYGMYGDQVYSWWTQTFIVALWAQVGIVWGVGLGF